MNRLILCRRLRSFVRLQQRMSDYFQTTWSLNHGIETYEVSKAPGRGKGTDACSAASAVEPADGQQPLMVLLLSAGFLCNRPNAEL